MDKQIAAGRLEAERIAQFTEAEVVRVYRDEISGATRFEDRPEGATLLKDAKRGKFDTVVFYALDRFTRNVGRGLADFSVMEDELGLTLVFAKENIDTSTASGKLFRTLLAAFAEFERDTIRDRVMAGRYGSADRGSGWASGMPPFGFEVGHDGDLVEVYTEGVTLRRMFYLRAAGYTLAEVTFKINAEGYTPRPRGRSIGIFSVGAVHAYLEKAYYKGEPIRRDLRPSHGADAVPFYFEVPQIVEAEVWGKAQFGYLTTAGESV